jgi:hypothetical protein
MKIGLLTSYRAQEQYREIYEVMLQHFQKIGHEVVHHINTSLQDVLPLSYIEREELFINFYKELEECDVIFVDCPVQSTQLGFGIAYLRSKAKPIVLLTPKGTPVEYFPRGDIYSNVENMAIYEYEKVTIATVIDDALEYMKPHLDKRFTIIFPAHLLAKLEEQAQKLHVPKAVYIRQLIEKNLKETHSSE